MFALTLYPGTECILGSIESSIMESTMSDHATATSNRSLIAAVLAAVGASTCCAGPLVLLTLGISGSWIGNLSRVEPYRPLFIAITVAFLGLAFGRLYLNPAPCAEGSVCALPATRRRQRFIFWLVSVAALGIIGFPWYGPYILD